MLVFDRNENGRAWEESAQEKKPFIYFLVNNNRKNEKIRNQIITSHKFNFY